MDYHTPAKDDAIIRRTKRSVRSVLVSVFVTTMQTHLRDGGNKNCCGQQTVHHSAVCDWFNSKILE